MKVLQAIAGGAHGGAENFFTRLVLALHRAGVDQKVLMKPSAHRRQVLEDGGIMPYESSFSKWTPWTTRQAYSDLINDYQPDVVMTWMSRATHLCPQGPFLHVARLGGYYPLKYYKNCDHVIGITQGLVDHLKQGFWNSSQIHYIQNFAFLPEKGEARLRSEFQTPDSVPLILALGRLHPDKAFDILIPALAKVPNAYLWIAGEGEERNALENLVRSEGVEDRVRFLGWQTKTACLIKAADILAFPSRVEPHGTVTLEAWGYQKPLVAARSAGPGAMVRHEETGLLVDIDDVEGLSEALNRVINDSELTQSLVQNGTEEFQSKYTEEIVVKRYLDFFKNICHQSQKER